MPHNLSTESFKMADICVRLGLLCFFIRNELSNHYRINHSILNSQRIEKIT